ncbi:hypothetical protein Tco_1526820, partial [Tanacetum coccineum]
MIFWIFTSVICLDMAGHPGFWEVEVTDSRCERIYFLTYPWLGQLGVETSRAAREKLRIGSALIIPINFVLGEDYGEVDGQSSQQSEHEYINLDDETVPTQDTNEDLGERDIGNNNGEDE